MARIVVDIEKITKTYRFQNQPALKKISFRVKEGERIGIVGANGSGKTTLFRLLLNLIRPDSGQIRISGETDLEKAKQYIGYISEHQEGLDNFTPRELLTLAGKMAGIAGEETDSRCKELLSLTGLTEKQNTLVSGFSKGMVQRLQLALALVHRPALLLLDEPMSGLDPAGQNELRGLLRQLQNYTLLYASHNLAEIEDLCDRIIIFRSGEIVKDLQLSEQTEDIMTIESVPEIMEILQGAPGVKIRNQWQTAAGFMVEISAAHAALQKILADCQKNNVPVRRFRSRSLLEDLYEQFVKKR